MQMINTTDGVAHAIQLAIAPVFLLSAIATLLNVLTTRLGRITERVRNLKEKLENDLAEAKARSLRTDIATLSRRARLTYHAITLAVLTSLLICGVIATLFLGAYLHLDVDVTVMTLFVAAMLSLVSTLLFLLREILLAALKLIVPDPDGMK